MTADVSINWINWIGTKYVMGVFSNPGIMTEIVWKRRLIFCRFG